MILSRKLFSAFIALVFTFASTGISFAADDIQALIQRMDKLEQENASLRQEVTALKEQLNGVAQETKDLSTIAAKPTGKLIMTSKAPVNISMYGYIKADYVYSNNGDTLIMNAASDTHATESNITGNETRLGFDFDGPEIGDVGKISGKVEGDFWASSASEEKFRLRQAYVKLAYPKWDVLAGQTWDFFSPLGPATLNFGYGWRSGNIGDRHPQLILGNNWGDVLGGKLTTKIGVIDAQDDEQEKSGFPVGGAYVEYATKLIDMPLTVGVGGMYGEETQSAPLDNIPIWALSTTLKLKVTDWLSLSGEGFMGQDLNAFRSNGATIVHNKALRTIGGWMQVTVKPISKLEINLGSGVDEAVGETYATASVWDKNKMVFTNLKYDLTKNLVLGLELQKFYTDYANGTEGDANRVQTSIIYKF